MTDYPKTINADGVEIVDTSDAAWATYVAEGRINLMQAQARLAEAQHARAMLRQEIVHEYDSMRHDPDLLAAARALKNFDPAGPSVDEIIERSLAPAREAALADFDALGGTAAPSGHKPGATEAAFLNKLNGGSK